MKNTQDLIKNLIAQAQFQETDANAYAHLLSDIAQNELFNKYLQIANELIKISDAEKRLDRAIGYWQELRVKHSELSIDDFYMDIEILISMLYCIQATDESLSQAKSITVRYTKLNPITVILLKRLKQTVDVTYSF